MSQWFFPLKNPKIPIKNKILTKKSPKIDKITPAVSIFMAFEKSFLFYDITILISGYLGK
jgi:hypothetical protein